jgi:hypothetical protein
VYDFPTTNDEARSPFAMLLLLLLLLLRWSPSP